MTLRLTEVSKTFGDVRVLADVSIEVDRGSRIAIVGASGSGKSTLLRIIAGFERPTTGVVSLGDRVLASPTVDVGAHRRGIGYVPQDGALFPHLTVRANIGFGLRRSARRDERVREVASLSSLDPVLLDRYPHQLSGGQQQRVALARALAPAPSVILLDEPFSALDTGLRVHTRAAMISALERSGVTAVLVTHDQEEALSFGQQLAVIADGHLVQAGLPATVFDAPLNPAIAEFLGAAVFVPVQLHGDGTVRCALGELSVRHDHRHDSGSAQAMVRPAQLRLHEAGDAEARTAEAGTVSGTAQVVAARHTGSVVELDLRFVTRGHDGLSLTHRLPWYEAHRFAVGSEVTVSVEGGAVLYSTGAAPEAVVTPAPR